MIFHFILVYGLLTVKALSNVLDTVGKVEPVVFLVNFLRAILADHSRGISTFSHECILFVLRF